MTASHWELWNDRIPGNKGFDKMGPNAVARAFELAKQTKAAQEENSAGSFAYQYGSPQKSASPQFDSRFAGDVLIGGINGEFGRVTNDKNNKEGQQALETFMNQYMSGIYAPGGMPMAGDMPPQETA